MSEGAKTIWSLVIMGGSLLVCYLGWGSADLVIESPLSEVSHADLMDIRVVQLGVIGFVIGLILFVRAKK